MSDLRTIKTINAINSAFFDLLACEEFSEITVKQITNKCLINRSTFYKHYEDKYQLRDSIIDEIILDFNNNMEVAFLITDELNSMDYAKILKSSLLHMKNNQTKYEILWNSLTLGRNVFEEMINSGALKMQKSILENKNISITRKERAEWYSKLLVNNLMVSIRWWFANAEKLTSDEMTALIIEHMDHGTIPTLLN